LVNRGDAASPKVSYGRRSDRKEARTMQQVERYETVIIGGGQAGLSVGYHLKRQGHPFLILDASERVGDSWRERWDSLRLYSPASRDGLPGMPFPAPRTTYPTKDEMGDYLDAYATRFELPVRSGVTVEMLTKENGRYVVSAGAERFEADNVVVATGVFKRPYTPEFATELDPSITQLHSNDYRNLSQLQAGPTLVVGASHSGSDIAYEAAASHDVILAGRDTGQIPAPIESRRGRMGFRVLVFVGTHLLNVDTPLGRKMRPHVRQGGGPLLRYRRKDLLAAGIERVLDRTVAVEQGLPVLEDGRVLDVRNVVWCTGFRPDFSWVRFPFEIGDDGYPVQYRGSVASSPGLYFAGLPFLHSFASMLVAGAGRDAERVAHHIVERRAVQLDARPDDVVRAAVS
jgi:putative flavoprotein involved in K+ transport